MSTDKDERRLDEKGRITIPQRIRNQLNLEPGARVRLEVDEGTVIVRPRVSRSEFVETMRGCISEETAVETTPSVTPAELKADWTSDLPTRKKD